MQIKSEVKFSKQQIQNIFEASHSSLLQKAQFLDLLNQLKYIQGLRTIEKLCRPIPQKTRQQLMNQLNRQLKILQKKLQKVRSIRQSQNSQKNSIQTQSGSSPRKLKVPNKSSYERSVNSVYLKGSQLYGSINEKMKIITSVFGTEQLYFINWEEWRLNSLNNNRSVGCGCFG